MWGFEVIKDDVEYLFLLYDESFKNFDIIVDLEDFLGELIVVDLYNV